MKRSLDEELNDPALREKARKLSAAQKKRKGSGKRYGKLSADALNKALEAEKKA